MAPQLLGRGNVKPTDSTHGVASSGFPLGVKCNFCLHRSLVDGKELKAKFPQPRLLSSLRFKCRRCGSVNFHLELFWSRASVTRFMRADE